MRDEMPMAVSARVMKGYYSLIDIQFQ